MSTLARLPRKAKRQKTEQPTRTTQQVEEEQGDASFAGVESWQEVAKEAQRYRNSTFDEVEPPIPGLETVPWGNYKLDIGIPNSLLTLGEESITEERPEKLLEYLADGLIKSKTVTNAFLRRAGIASRLTNCVTELLPSYALERAEALDNHLAAHQAKPVGPLHGLPISIKEHIAFKGLRMTAGWVSWWYNDRPDSDALLIQILENAGAVLHARTTVPQGMMQLETQSNLYGTTTNPWNRKLSAGGSSGGEAALVSLRGSLLGVGSDIGGSIRVPAASCGVYGFKPTAFRIPANGWNCVAPSADTIPTVIGPISVSLFGIEIFMSTVLAAKPWIEEPSLNSMPWKPITTARTSEELLHIGVMLHDDQVLPHPSITRAIRELVARVEAHPELSKHLKFVDFPAYKHDYAWSLLSKLYYSDGGASDKAAIAASGEPLCPLFKWLLDEPSIKRLTRAQLELALEDREAFRDEYAKHWNQIRAPFTETPVVPVKEDVEDTNKLPNFTPYEAGIDVLLCPVAPYVASIPGKAKYWSYTSIWNLLDYPALSFPSPLRTRGDLDLDTKPDRETFMSPMDEEMWEWYDPKLYEDLPVSLQLVGRRNEDEKVIAVARFLEDLLGAEI